MDKKDHHSSLDSSSLNEGAARLDLKGRGNPLDSYAGEIVNDISFNELILKLHVWWNYLVSKWLIILIAGVIGGVGGFIYARSKKPTYTAELTFVLESGMQGGGISNYAGIASQFGINMGGGGAGVFEGENFLALMKSRLMIENTLMTVVHLKGRKETLAEYYIDMIGIREKWAKENSKLLKIKFPVGGDPSEFSSEQNSLMGGFHAALTGDKLFVGNKDKKSSIIAVRFTSEDELFSKYFIEALAREVSVFYVKTKTKKLADNLAILQYQTDSVKNAFNSAIQGAAISADANPNANPMRQLLRVPTQRKQLDVQINQAMLTQLVQNLEIAKMSLRTETPIIQEIDRPILPLPRDEFSTTKGLIRGGILGGCIAIFLLIVAKVLRGLRKV